ncbi:ADP-ribosyltransferase, partial [Cloacibacterium normanense]|uniref:ADP-ribosyltransferase n=1 Tax=Cloacibacterium normanense TaxID=237258 RepID=UPI00352DA9E8
YYPPNGWRCRCIVVLVLASKYPATDVDKATAAAEKATTQIGKNGKNKLEMFRFNPGLEKRVFPKGNSYEKVVGADKVEEVITKKLIDYENLTVDKIEELYKTQKIDKTKENLIMGGENGYVGTANSFRLNEMLRYGYDIEGDDKLTISSLDDLIKSNRLKGNYLFHRNVDDDFIGNKFGFNTWGKSAKEIIQKMKDSNLKSYSDPGYCSVSAIEKKNVFQMRKVQIKIRAKEGTNAFITTNSSESEIILGRNQKFNIIDFEESENDIIKIIVETE